MQKKWQNEKKDRMMSDKKAVFFDADGTICDIEKGVPDSAIESIKKLIANGCVRAEAVHLCRGILNGFHLQG